MALSQFPRALTSTCLVLLLLIANGPNAWAEDVAGGNFDVRATSPQRGAMSQQLTITGDRVALQQGEPPYACLAPAGCPWTEVHYEFSFHPGIVCTDITSAPYNIRVGYSRIFVGDETTASIQEFYNGHSLDVQTTNIFFIDAPSAAAFVSRCNANGAQGEQTKTDGALKMTTSVDGLGNIRLDVTNSSRTTTLELDSYSISNCVGIIECGTRTLAMSIPPGMTKLLTSITRGNTDANGNQPAMSFAYGWTYRALGNGANSSRIFTGSGTSSSSGGGPMTSQGGPGPAPAAPPPRISNPMDPTADPAWQDRVF
jgi:hypothetical protein